MNPDEIDHVMAYDLAVDMVTKAGFVLHHAAPKSESCYYAHPSKSPLLFRISRHKSPYPLGAYDVTARVSFTYRETSLTRQRVAERVMLAIGRYFISEVT